MEAKGDNPKKRRAEDDGSNGGNNANQVSNSCVEVRYGICRDKAVLAASFEISSPFPRYTQYL